LLADKENYFRKRQAQKTSTKLINNPPFSIAKDRFALHHDVGAFLCWNKMARMYSRRRGKAGSKKPSKRVKPAWLSYKPKEVEQLVIKFSKADKSPSQIGMILRDTYGIPDIKAVTGKRITQILRENNLSQRLPENLVSLIKKHIRLMKHLENNKKDLSAKRGEIITESKINKLVKYYKRTEVLPKDWVYDKTKAKLLVG